MSPRFVALALAVLFPLASLAEEVATTKDAQQMVQRAVSFLKKEGKEKAFAAFSDPKGQFRFRDLYIFAFDLEGTTVAHGARRDLIGKSALGLKDADGRLFIQEGLRIAKEKGRGWNDYKWQNPATGAIEQKTVYLELVDGVVVGSGAYRRK